MEVTFEVENPQLVSVNEAYLHPMNKYGKSYFTKSKKLKDVQTYFSEILPKYISEEFISGLQEIVNRDMHHGVKLELTFGFPINDIYFKDASNLIKAIEDCISEYIQVDDSYNLFVSAEKKISSKEKLRVTISDYKVDLFDQV